MMRLPSLLAAVVACSFASSLCAQDTRAAVVATERAAKADETTAAGGQVTEPSRLERLTSAVSTAIDTKRADGFSPVFGGPVPGSGLAGGVGYRHGLVGGLRLDASTTLSVRGYREAQATIMRTSRSTGSAMAGQFILQTLPQLNYFGIGPNSQKAARANYGMTRLGVSATGSVPLTRAVGIEWRAGYTEAHLGAGTSTLAPSIETRFDEQTAPGLAESSKYLHGGGALRIDWRDQAGYPTEGGEVRVGLERYASIDGASRRFAQFDVDAVHYIPIIRRNFTIVVRERLSLSRPDGGTDVPFYMLPTLGGSNTLRGFSEYRFRDRHAALLNVEYRWPIFRMMDGALFVDAGRVAPTLDGLRRAPLHRDAGLGLRIHTPTRVIATVDLARSAEGLRVSVGVSAPLKSRHGVAPYVP